MGGGSSAYSQLRAPFPAVVVVLLRTDLCVCVCALFYVCMFMLHHTPPCHKTSVYGCVCVRGC